MYNAFKNYFGENLIGCIFEQDKNSEWSSREGGHCLLRISHGKLVNVSFIDNYYHLDNVKSMAKVNDTLCIATRDNKYWFKLNKVYNKYEEDNDGIDIIYKG